MDNDSGRSSVSDGAQDETYSVSEQVTHNIAAQSDLQGADEIYTHPYQQNPYDEEYQQAAARNVYSTHSPQSMPQSGMPSSSSGQAFGQQEMPASFRGQPGQTPPSQSPYFTTPPAQPMMPGQGISQSPQSIESFLGRYILAGLAAFMIIAATASFIGLYWSALTDVQKLLVIVSSGVLLIVIGAVVKYFVPKMWVPAHVLVATGASMCGIAIVSGSTVYDLLPFDLSILLMMTWAVILVGLSYVLGDLMTTSIVAIGMVYIVGLVQVHYDGDSFHTICLTIGMLAVYLIASVVMVDRMKGKPKTQHQPQKAVLYLAPAWVASLLSAFLLMMLGTVYYGVPLISALFVVSMSAIFATLIDRKDHPIVMVMIILGYIPMAGSASVFHVQDLPLWASTIIFIALWACALGAVFLLRWRSYQEAALGSAIFFGLYSFLRLSLIAQHASFDTFIIGHHKETDILPIVSGSAMWIAFGFALMYWRDRIYARFSAVYTLAIPVGVTYISSSAGHAYYWPSFVLSAALIVYIAIVVDREVHNQPYFEEQKSSLDPGVFSTARKINHFWRTWQAVAWTYGAAVYFTIMSIYSVFSTSEFGNIEGHNQFSGFSVGVATLSLLFTGFIVNREHLTPSQFSHERSIPALYDKDAYKRQTSRLFPREFIGVFFSGLAFFTAPFGANSAMKAMSDLPLDILVPTVMIIGMFMNLVALIWIFHRTKNDAVDWIIIVGVFYMLESIIWILDLVSLSNPIHSAVGVIIGVIALWLGMRSGKQSTRIGGLVFIIVAVLKLTIIDVAAQQPATRIISLVVGAIVCFALSIIYTKFESKLHEPQGQTPTMFQQPYGGQSVNINDYTTKAQYDQRNTVPVSAQSYVEQPGAVQEPGQMFYQQNSSGDVTNHLGDSAVAQESESGVGVQDPQNNVQTQYPET